MGTWRISLKNLGLAFTDSLEVLRDISLEILPNYIYSLVGPNGSGKTTFMKLLAGILKPTRGSIEMLDEDEIPLNMRREVLLSFQNPDISFSHLTLRRDLMEVLSLRGENLEDIWDRLADLGIPSEYIDRELDTLSYGWRKILSLSEYLLLPSKLLCLDEPTANLDLSWSMRIWGFLFRERAKRGFGLIFSTHRPDELLIADRILYIDRGTIKEVSHKELLAINSDYIKAMLTPQMANILANWDTSLAEELRSLIAEAN